MALNVGKYTTGIISVCVAAIIATTVALPVLTSAVIPEGAANHDALVALVGVVPIAIILGLVLAAFRGMNE